MKLEVRFMIYTLRAFAMLMAVFFPILYLSDFLFSEAFSFFYALAKMPFRYGQSLSSLLLWSVWLGVRNMRRLHGDATFITIGFLPRHALKFMIALSIIFMSLDAFVFIPCNGIFPQQVIKTNWSIKQVKQDASKKGKTCTAFVHKMDDHIELWQVDGGTKYIQGNLCNNIATFHDAQSSFNLKFDEDDFFVLWNEPKKLTFKGLKNCAAYMNHHGLDDSDVTMQWHIFVARITLIISMVVCGFALGWKDSVTAIIVCCILSNWLNQVVIFMPLLYGIICLWANVLFWMVFGCLLL